MGHREPLKYVDLVKLRAFERDKIVQIFGIPPGYFGPLRANRYAALSRVAQRLRKSLADAE